MGRQGGQYEPHDSRNVTGTASTPDGRWTNLDGRPPRAAGQPDYPPEDPEDEQDELDEERDEDDDEDLDDDEERDDDRTRPMIRFEPDPVLERIIGGRAH